MEHIEDDYTDENFYNPWDNIEPESDEWKEYDRWKNEG